MKEVYVFFSLRGIWRGKTVIDYFVDDMAMVNCGLTRSFIGANGKFEALLRRGAHTLFGLSMPEQRGKWMAGKGPTFHRKL